MFHLAIPTHDLQVIKSFYAKLGVTSGKVENNYLILNFFGHQVVCHLDPSSIPTEVQMYPRHFGYIVPTEKEYLNLLKKAQGEQLAFFKHDFHRFQGGVGEHRSFFLRDPSSNLIEFKWYKNSKDIFR